MNVTTEKVAEGQVALTIEVEPEAVEKAMNQAYQRLVTRTLVPGFRKGKAPRPMLERYLGHGALLEEALERLIPQVFQEAVKEENITPFAEPRYEVVQVEPVIVKATVDLPPVVELGDYHEVRATLSVPEVTEQDVDDAIERIRESMATWEPVEGPVKLDDRVTIDVRGTKDGEEFFTRENYPYSVSAGNPVPVPGFAEHLVGMEKGSELEFDISFPADHEDKTVAGHDFHFWVKVDGITTKQLPPLDDELAKSTEEGVETLEALRQKVRENLAESNERRAKEELVDKVVNEVVDTSKLEVPPSLVDQEVHRIIEDEEERLQRQRFSLSQYLKLIGKSPEEFHDELNPEARNRVRRSLVLSKVAEAEEIKAEPSEVDAEIEQVVGEAGEQREQILELLNQPATRAAIERSIVTRKTLNRLVQIATEGAVNYPEITRAPAAAETQATEEAGAQAAEESKAQATEEAEPTSTTESTEPEGPEAEQPAQE